MAERYRKRAVVLPLALLAMSAAVLLYWQRSGGIDRITGELIALGADQSQLAEARQDAVQTLAEQHALAGIAEPRARQAQERLSVTVQQLQRIALQPVASMSPVDPDRKLGQLLVQQQLQRLSDRASSDVQARADAQAAEVARSAAQVELDRIDRSASDLTARMDAARAEKRALLNEGGTSAIGLPQMPPGLVLRNLPLDARSLVAGAPPVLRLPIETGETARWQTAPWGLSLSALPAAAVRAPADGLVAFAGDYRNYGNVILIDHNEGKHSLISGPMTSHVRVGEPVLQDEPIATVNLAASDTRPSIYIELRQDGRPIDPRPWYQGVTVAEAADEQLSALVDDQPDEAQAREDGRPPEEMNE